MSECARCLFYIAKGENRVGRCRRHAPTATGFPIVNADDWCGDHELRPLRESIEDIFRDAITKIPPEYRRDSDLVNIK